MPRAAVAADSDEGARALEEMLGHRFADRRWLAAGLRHSSLRQRKRTAEFERLEFLGDRVVGLVVADLLLRRFPDEPEGHLARRHAALVQRDTLAQVARDIGLGAHLVLAPGEDSAGGRDSPGVLADAFEAVIGALFRDGGFEPARAFVARSFASLLDQAGRPPQDAKTALQEWAQARGLALPAYRTHRVEGPAHKPVFKVEVSVEGLEAATGEGASKRAAEQAAATALLQRAKGQSA